MSKSKSNLKNARTSLPADRLVQSVGIGLLAAGDRLKALDPNDWYAKWEEVVDELELYSGLLAALHQASENTLAAIEVELPRNIVAVTTPNPYFDPKAKRPGRKDTGLDDLDIEEFPF